MDEFEHGVFMVVLTCNHDFQEECYSAWVAYLAQGGRTPTCPQCRAEAEVSAHFRYDADVDSPLDTSDAEVHNIGSDSFVSVQTSMPWWPAHVAESIAACYHASTRLPDGRLSLIMDPGAWTSLLRGKIARALATKA